MLCFLQHTYSASCICDYLRATTCAPDHTRAWPGSTIHVTSTRIWYCLVMRVYGQVHCLLHQDTFQACIDISVDVPHDQSTVYTTCHRHLGLYRRAQTCGRITCPDNSVFNMSQRSAMLASWKDTTGMSRWCRCAIWPDNNVHGMSQRLCIACLSNGYNQRMPQAALILNLPLYICLVILDLQTILCSDSLRQWMSEFQPERVKDDVGLPAYDTISCL